MKYGRNSWIRYLFYFVSALFGFFIITTNNFVISYLDLDGTLHYSNNPQQTLWRRTDKLNTTNDNLSDDRILAQLKWILEEVQPTTIKKMIFLNDKSFTWLGYKKEDFRKQCPRLADFCEFSKDLQTYPVDAVISFYQFLNESMETFYNNYYFKRIHPPSITKVIIIYESNMYLTGGRAELSGDDILVSYWKNADIVKPYGYGKWIFYNETNFKNNPKGPYNYAKGKTRFAAIFISNCYNAANNRMSFVKELQKYITVDIYGRCGTLNCPRNITSKTSPCFDMLKKDYKFYLAFENSNCRNYITEKLFRNALRHQVVPVVMGAHPDDYASAAPPNSYIHVEDFKDVESLANYLKYLNENDDEYNKYFQWSKVGKYIDTKILCRICGMLHYKDIVPNPHWEKTVYWQGQYRNNDNGSNGLVPCLPRGKQRWKV